MRGRRFLYIFLFIMAFNFLGNGLGFVTARLERSMRKYKKRYIVNKYPQLMAYQSALDTAYETKKISQQSTDKLSEAFIRIDR